MAKFPPSPDNVIHEDVKALFRLAGVNWTWHIEKLEFLLRITRGRFFAETYMAADQLQDLEFAQFLVQGMVQKLETAEVEMDGR